MNKENTTPAVDQKLPLSKNITLGLQHMIIAILATIPVPLLISDMTNLPPDMKSAFISSSILVAGISTILISLNIIKGTSPMVPAVMGAAFPVITVAVKTITEASSIDIGFREIAGATLISGLFCFFLAPVWSKLSRLFPPVVVGTNLMILGVALLPNTFHWIMSDKARTLTEGVDPKNLFLALGVFLLHVILSKYLKGFLGNLTILIALVVGTIASILMGMMDFTAVVDSTWFGVSAPFSHGWPIFKISTILPFLIVMVLGMVEISGTVMGIHNIVGKEMNDKQLTKTLRTTGINTVLSGSLNAVQPTIFVQNLGILDLSKVFSRFTTATAGIMLLLVGFVPKFSAFIGEIPHPVLGGIGFAVFGIIIGSAVNLLKSVEFSGNQNMLIVGLSVGIAMIPATYPDFYKAFGPTVGSILGSGVLAGSIAAILLNLFFNFKDVIKKKSS